MSQTRTPKQPAAPTMPTGAALTNYHWNQARACDFLYKALTLVATNPAAALLMARRAADHLGRIEEYHTQTPGI